MDGLFSALVTMGVVPIIRCPKGGLAQHVAQTLAHKLREHLAQRGTMSPRRAMPWTLVCDVGKVRGELDIHYLGQAIRLGGLCTDMQRIHDLGHNHYFLFIVRSIQFLLSNVAYKLCRTYFM